MLGWLSEGSERGAAPSPHCWHSPTAPLPPRALQVTKSCRGSLQSYQREINGGAFGWGEMACSSTPLCCLLPRLVTVLAHGCTSGAIGQCSPSAPLWKRIIEASPVGINLQKSKPVHKCSQTREKTLSRNLGHGVR